MSKSKVIFITATDTGVGKTAAVYVLGVLLQAQGFDVGIMKPVQCAGDDAQFLKQALGLQDDLERINPFFAPEALSPHLALRRAKVKFKKERVQDCLSQLRKCHDIVLVEGAGGLLAPIAPGYYMANLAADLKAGMIIVARPGLGTINHTLLTINEARRRRLPIAGIVFCQTTALGPGLPEQTNAREIEKLSGIPTIGTIPYLKPLNRENILRTCRTLRLSV
jgi:dethiobiotin synthetase